VGINCRAFVITERVENYLQETKLEKSARKNIMVLQLKGIDIKLESNGKYCNSKFKMLANLSSKCGNTGQYKSVLFFFNFNAFSAGRQQPVFT
jgi:hypothetical protein